MHMTLTPSLAQRIYDLPATNPTRAGAVFANRMVRGDHGPRLALSQPMGKLNAQTVIDKARGRPVAEIRDDVGDSALFRVFYCESPLGWEHSITLDARGLDVLFDYVELGVAVDDAVWTLVHH